MVITRGFVMSKFCSFPNLNLKKNFKGVGIRVQKKSSATPSPKKKVARKKKHGTFSPHPQFFVGFFCPVGLEKCAQSKHRGR